MAPKRPSPLNRIFAKTPSLDCFFSLLVPNSKSGTELGSRAGAGHAPELGSRAGRPAAAAPLAEEAVPSRSGGEAELPRRPSPALPLPRQPLPLRRCPELPPAAPVLRSPSKGSSTGAPLAVEVLHADAPLARRRKASASPFSATRNFR
jgi:hypothetical protein